jgi:hypothetical protein
MKNKQLILDIINASYDCTKGRISYTYVDDGMMVWYKETDTFPQSDFVTAISPFCTYFFMYSTTLKKVVLSIF